MVAYELHKFVRLCLGFNPNVIPLLYLRPSDYLEVHPGGQLLLDNRDAFMSVRAYDTFIGYARGQLSNVRRGITGKYGEKRKALIRQYGYDVKFAYHTIRLLRMIVEVMTARQINAQSHKMGGFKPVSENFEVYRGNIDAAELMEIREGHWSLDRFFEEADKLIVIAEHMKVKADFPEQPDYDRVNKLVMDIVEKFKF
jgi:hypothetical protein